MKGFLLSIFTVLVFIGCSDAEQKANYNYISAKETASLIRTSPEKILLIDIQKKEGFDKEHLKGAISTYAYPVKTDEDRAKLTKILPIIKPDQKIVVICPGGAGGAARASDYLLSTGVKKENIFTLANGQNGWPRDEITDVLVK